MRVRAEKIKKEGLVFYCVALYNLTQVLLCGWLVYSALVEHQRRGFKLVCNVHDLKEDGMAFIGHIFYLSKALDFVDTMFMIIKGNWRQVSFLHVYHHVAMFFIWWFAVKFCAGGDGIAGPVFNTFVHAVMYTYYLATSLGVTIPGKRYLTQLQMTQLFSVTMHSVLCIALDCKYPHWTQYAQIAFLMSLLYLFWQFYQGAYSKKGRKPRKTA